MRGDQDDGRKLERELKDNIDIGDFDGVEGGGVGGA